MRKSFLFLLSVFFVLPAAQAHPYHSSHSITSLKSVTPYHTVLTDHNPPNLIVDFYPPAGSDAMVRPGSVPERTISITATAKGLKGYTANEMSLQFYTYKNGNFIRIKPGDFFDFEKASREPGPQKLTQSLVMANGKPAEVGRDTQAIFKFILKPTVALPLHLVIVASPNYNVPGVVMPVPKGPVFTTLLLEPQ